MRRNRRPAAVVAAAAVVLTAAVQAAPATAVPAVTQGRLVALGSLGGGESWAERMNERGDIAGASADPAWNWQPVVWRHDRSTPTPLPVGPATVGAISDNGHVAGRVHATGALFVLRNGAVRYVRSLPRTDPEVTGVDDRGRVVGTAYRADGTHRAFVVQRGRLSLLPAPKGSDSSAVGVNNRGQIIGTVTARGTTAERAVMWQHGRLTRLGTLGGATSTPVAINDRGQVIGRSTIRASADEHPFLWQRGRMTDLLAGTTADGGTAYAISDTGIVAGAASGERGESRPVVWRAGRMTDIGLPGHTGIASAVNDRGDVAARTWADPEAEAVPFRWRRGTTTLYPEPPGDISFTIIGIDAHGRIAVAQETTRRGLTVLRAT